MYIHKIKFFFYNTCTVTRLRDVCWCCFRTLLTNSDATSSGLVIVVSYDGDEVNLLLYVTE